MWSIAPQYNFIYVLEWGGEIFEGPFNFYLEFFKVGFFYSCQKQLEILLFEMFA